MPSVTINAPKTPVTKGSSGIAAATLPNVCKMPGPPAPFVPTPLPNIGKSGMSPRGYSTTVKFEGSIVAIAGASFGSMGDIASKGTGGGLTSFNCEGPTKFIAPGSMDTQVQGKNVQLLGDQMLNNCGPSGSPANAATMMGAMQGFDTPSPPTPECQAAGDSINNVVHGNPDFKSMKQRSAELKANPGSQPMFWEDANPGIPRPKGSDQFGHLVQIEQQQKQLARALASYYENGCTHLDQQTLNETSSLLTVDPFSFL